MLIVDYIISNIMVGVIAETSMTVNTKILKSS